jgi:hypothetical protein
MPPEDVYAEIPIVFVLWARSICEKYNVKSYVLDNGIVIKFYGFSVYCTRKDEVCQILGIK